jgi:hypothetical protein
MSDGVRWASRSSTGTVRIRMHNKLAALSFRHARDTVGVHRRRGEQIRLSAGRDRKPFRAR